jgi:branched-chain amino acid transport system substrate-binding protein
MGKWKVATVAATVLTMVFAAGCGGKAETKTESKDIKIGGNFEMTGGVAQYGQSAANGIKLAFKEANAAGGVLGKQLTLIIADNKSEPAESANAATKLISQDKVVALIGPAASANVLASVPVATDSKIPLLTPTGTNTKITVENGKVKDFIFRSCFIDPFQGAIMANFASKDLKAKTAVLYVDSSSDYSKGLAQVFGDNFAKNGGKILATEAFLQKDQDFKSALTKIKAANPDVIYIPAYYEEASKIIKQARELGIMIPMLGTDGWDSPKLPEIAGAAALANTFFSNHYSAQDKDPRVVKFVEAYKKEYNQDPDALAVLGYDGALMMIDAIKRANSTEPAKIKEALAQTKNLQVVTGMLSMDANHDPIKSAVIIEMKDGKQTFRTKVNP